MKSTLPLSLTLFLSSCVATSTLSMPEPVVAHTDLAKLEQRLRREYEQTTPHAKGAVVVGVFDGTSTLVVGFGEVSPDDRRVPDDSTVFEIGSITKAMSGVLLADEVNRGRLALDDEAQHWLGGTRLPRHEAGPIRVEHLATFSSGLPFMPSNWIPVDQGTYTPAMWHDFLATYELPFAPGTGFGYGNVGFGVLGDVLAAREGTTLGKLFHDRLFLPLHMSHSWLLDERPADARFAQGHDTEGHLVPLRFDKPIQAACCAVESTARDLLAFMRAPIDPGTPAELRSAFDLAMTARRHGEGNYGDRDVGLGWFMRRDEPFFIAIGSMRGHRTAAVLDRARGIVTVVLAADTTFPSEALAMEARQAVLVERDQPQLTAVAAVPEDASPAHVTWEGGLTLLGWSAPKAAKRGETVTVHYYYRATQPIAADWTVFIHGDVAGSSVRVHGDHAPTRPTSDWPVSTIIDDRVSLVIPADHPGGTMTLWSGLYRSDRMHVTSTESTDGHDRVRGPVVSVE